MMKNEWLVTVLFPHEFLFLTGSLMEMCQHFVNPPRRLICPSSRLRKRQSH